MSPVSDIPVFYVFGRSALDIDLLLSAVSEKFQGTTKYLSSLFSSCRTVYVTYDLAFQYCSSSFFKAIKEICPNALLGKVVRSQNLSDEVEKPQNCVQLGYHYFESSTFDPDSILIFVGKDGINTNDYHLNENMYSILVDSGLSQACVYTDGTLRTIV